MNSSEVITAPSAPSFSLLGMEPLRAALEYAGMHLMDKTKLPPGDGHPVVVFPGLASDAHATAPLRSFCENLGYAAYDWGRGFNTGPEGDVDEWLDTLAADVSRVVGSHSDTMTLIGWSLGGIYARELAKRLSGVRRVITIGTPFAGQASQTHVSRIYKWLNGQEAPTDQALYARLRQSPGVPTTSIYSRSDGIVAWQACIQEGGMAEADNVEVEGSHCGMGWNAAVLSVVADRLSRGAAHEHRAT